MSNEIIRRKARNNRLDDTFSFSPGQILRRGTVVFKIVAKHGEQLVIQHGVSLEEKLVPMSLLEKEYTDSMLIPAQQSDLERAAKDDLFVEDESVSFSLQFSGISESALGRARMLKIYIDRLRACGYASLRPNFLLEVDFNRIKKELASDPLFDKGHLSVHAVYKGSRTLDAARGDWRALIPNFADRGGRNKSRIATQVSEELEKLLQETELNTRAKIDYSEIEKRLMNALINKMSPDRMLGLLPGRSTIERRVKSHFSAFDICKRNRGLKVAQKKYRSHFPRDRAEVPLQTIEFDDKDTRVYLVDERSGLPYGRAFVTSGMDQYSAAFMGASISENYRNTWSALNAYRNSILPKDIKGDANYSGVATSAEFYGCAAELLFDNALYNYPESLMRAILETSGAITKYAKPFTPTEKSIVEDFNGRMDHMFLSKLDGYGGEKSRTDRLLEGIETSNLTVQQFRSLFYRWVYDEYSNTPREKFGLTPRQMWHKGIEHITPRLPTNLHRINASIGIGRFRKLCPAGVTHSTLAWQNERLIQLTKKIGESAEIYYRYNPENLGAIYVLDPNHKEYFLVETAAPNYANNLTLLQHKYIRQVARENGKRNPAIADLLHARNQLVRIASQLSGSKKKKERYVGRIMTGAENDQISPHQKMDEMVTPLEHKMQEISEIEIELEEECWEMPEGF